jgi:protein N-terminal methyltransferase
VSLLEDLTIFKFYSIIMSAFSSEDSTLSVKTIQDLVLASLGKIEGMDTEDREYDSLEALWDYELSSNKKEGGGKTDATGEDVWYGDAKTYWDDVANCPVTDDGVLGGYGKLTPVDTVGSNAFLDAVKLKRPELQFDHAADCGAGIGRVTKNLLLPRFKEVSLVEVSPRLLASAPDYVGDSGRDRIHLIEQGLQDFDPAPGTYDVIWIQWVIGHLHDLDFVRFFKRCAKGLRAGGVIALKDNCTENCTFLVDKEDSSVARNTEYIRILLHLSGLTIIEQVKQIGFPDELFPVYMFALIPSTQS